jgi:hypothetical protein
MLSFSFIFLPISRNPGLSVRTMIRRSVPLSFKSLLRIFSVSSRLVRSRGSPLSSCDRSDFGPVRARSFSSEAAKDAPEPPKRTAHLFNLPVTQEKENEIPLDQRHPLYFKLMKKILSWTNLPNDWCGLLLKRYNKTNSSRFFSFCSHTCFHSCMAKRV